VGIFECEALIYGCRLKVGMIGSVCTHPEYRGRGLATALLRDAFEKMRRDGVNIVMISGIRGLYDRAGCAIAGAGYEIELTRERLATLSTEGVEVLEGGGPWEYAAIYQRECVRYVRPLRHLEKLFESRAWYVGKPTRRIRLLVLEAGEPVGYLIVHVPEGGVAGRVVEYAGCREALVRALRAAVEAHGLEALKLKVPAWDVDMISALRRHGLELPHYTTPLADTVRLLNVEDAFDKLQPYFSERVDEEVGVRAEDDVYRVAVGCHEVVLRGPKELAWLVFGVPDRVPEAFRRFMAGVPEIPEAFKSVFPIPLVPYGLYYT
ncbi:MAG TPA: GNAT family N-acetyltransferase, partial [Thermofilaceae archaeon]|nr:GNAT family N-acetyltransferase [Thermofilaceae archaeon]